VAGGRAALDGLGGAPGGQAPSRRRAFASAFTRAVFGR
jgi:hypothetical protein